MFWFVSILLICVTIAAVLYPLWRGKSESKGEDESSADAEVYKRQLDELERDVAAGLVPEEEAEATRTEIGHRLLAADRIAKAKREGGAHDLSDKQRMIYSGLAIVIIPLVAITLYLRSGMPGYSDRPYDDRCDKMSAESHENVDMGFMTDCLARKMVKSPTVEGYAILARSYLSLERYEDASQAFARALDLGGPRADLLEGLGMAEITASRGLVTETARLAFSKARELDPQAMFPWYYMAEYYYQNGDPIKAMRTWTDLLEATPTDSPYYAEIDKRIQMAIADTEAAETGSSSQAPTNPHQAQDPHASLPQSSPHTTGQGSTLTGLSEDQKAMIQNMVTGLSARLKANPNDLDGWLRLAKSYSVLGEQDLARQALSDASVAFLDNAEALKQIVATSAELGLADGPKVEGSPH